MGSESTVKCRASVSRRALLAAFGAWAVLQVVTALAWSNPLTVRLILSPDFGQSQKLINVWTAWQPLPRMTLRPPVAMMFGYLIYSILHVAAFVKLFPLIPGRRWGSKAAAFAVGILVFQYGYFEFFGPFNQYHEPLPLIAYEMFLQGLMALSEALVISGLLTPILQSSTRETSAQAPHGL